MSPHQALTLALAELNEDGKFTPCANDPRFTSDDLADTTAAAFECFACPVFDLCDAAGSDEAAGVWAGIDRSKNTRRKKTA